MMLFKNKKSSLELSIRTIVIVVLAMTLLGLGLGFIRSMFINLGETSFAVQDQIKQQILEDLRTGDKKLSFPTSEIKIGKQDSKILAIGIKNTGESANTFYVLIDVVSGVGSPGSVASSAPVSGLGTFVWDEGAQPLGVNEANVYPVKFTSESTTGTSIIKVSVALDQAGGTIYATKSFFITVT